MTRIVFLSEIAGRYSDRSSGSPSYDYLRGVITVEAYHSIWREYERQHGIERPERQLPATDWRYSAAAAA